MDSIISSSTLFRRAMYIFLLLHCISATLAQTNVFNIQQFGAVADGETDSSKALSSAWSQACESEGSSEVLVPKGTFLVLPVRLEGPCNGSIQLQIEGVLIASSDHSNATTGDNWLVIYQVNNLIVDGAGSLDGQGASAWPFNSCTNNSCSARLPVSLRFISMNSSTIKNIKSINSKFFHISVHQCQSLTFDGITLSAPADSPNTDGIHISKSTNITIVNSIIGTGDDCISLGPGSRAINISNVICGPGHGISIGSLGQTENEADVVGVTVRNTTFNGTDNGVRIKTWETPYSSKVSNITFIHLTMKDVKNPIIIDQSYCPHNSCSSNDNGSSEASHVEIEGVRYEDIRGTSKTEVAAEFNCSEAVPCKDIVVKDINLVFSDDQDASSTTTTTTSFCSNVVGTAFGQQIPPSCF